MYMYIYCSKNMVTKHGQLQILTHYILLNYFVGG